MTIFGFWVGDWLLVAAVLAATTAFCVAGWYRRRLRRARSQIALLRAALDGRTAQVDKAHEALRVIREHWRELLELTSPPATPPGFRLTGRRGSIRQATAITQAAPVSRDEGVATGD